MTVGGFFFLFSILFVLSSIFEYFWYFICFFGFGDGIGWGVGGFLILRSALISGAGVVKYILIDLTLVSP